MVHSQRAMYEERGEDWVAVACEGVVYMRLHGVMRRDIVDASRRLHDVALEQRKAGIGFMLDLGESVSLPSRDDMRYAVDMLARYQDGILVHATVFSSQGLVATAIRSTLNGMFTLARSPYARAILGSHEECVRFVRTRLGLLAPDEKAMLDTLQSLGSS